MADLIKNILQVDRSADKSSVKKLLSRCASPQADDLANFLALRPSNTLRRANIRTLGDVIKYSRDKLTQIRNFNEHCFVEFVEQFGKLGLYLRE